MSLLRFSTPPRLPTFVRWTTPLLTTALSAAVTFAVLPRPGIAPFVMFFSGIGLASWLAGRGAGMVSVGLSAVVANLFFVESHFGGPLSSSALLAMGLFVVSSGSVAWFAGSLRDAMTRLDDAATRLADANRRKDEFLAVLSHELRNPLTPIRNSLHILCHAECGSAQEARAKRIIERQAAHMTRLVDDLLDVSRIVHARFRVEKEEIELAALVREAVEDHRSTFEFAGVRLELAADDPRIWVRGDWARLTQVISNLLNNAVKFTPSGGLASVLVEVVREQRTAIVRVLDTGPGIAPHVLEHLFEPFTQADRTLAHSEGGLGLGLSTAKAIVELHGGTISARNRPDSAGTELIVRLPMDRVSVTFKASPSPPKTQPATARVLIIEDNRDSADSLRDVLELRGLPTEVAYDSAEGLQKIQTLKPDLVLCDIGLSPMDGFAIARTVRQDPSMQRTYLVALSGYALHEDVERSMAAGFDEHMAKPPSIEGLEKVLGNVSSKAHATAHPSSQARLSAPS